MNINIRTLITTLLLIIVQALLDNYIDLGLYTRIVITPYIIINLPYKRGSVVTMIYAFLIGLAMDILSGGVMGLNAGALVAASLIRQKILHTIINDYSMRNHEGPEFAVFGYRKSIFYISSIVLVYFVCYTYLSNFSLHPFGGNLLKIVIGTLLNTLIILMLFKKLNTERL